MSRARPSEWYASGLRFECTLCGACCSGPSGLVEFTEAEARDMAAHLEVSVEEFLDCCARPFGEGYMLLEVPVEEGYDCVLLEREEATGLAFCRVHEVRPAQCRTFPFWPEYLGSREAWQKAARRCEGIGRGSLVPLDTIRRARDESPRTP